MHWEGSTLSGEAPCYFAVMMSWMTLKIHQIGPSFDRTVYLHTLTTYCACVFSLKADFNFRNTITTITCEQLISLFGENSISKVKVYVQAMRYQEILYLTCNRRWIHHTKLTDLSKSDANRHMDQRHTCFFFVGRNTKWCAWKVFTFMLERNQVTFFQYSAIQFG